MCVLECIVAGIDIKISLNSWNSDESSCPSTQPASVHREYIPVTVVLA